MLNYGQVPGDPIVAKLRSINLAVKTFAVKLSDQLARAKLCLEVAQQQMKHFSDQNRRLRLLQVGDQVLSTSRTFVYKAGYVKTHALFHGTLQGLSGAGFC